MVKNSFITIPLSLAFLISAPYAHAVSITMEKGPNGDRIRVTQTDENNNVQSIRVSPDALFIQVDKNDTDAPIQSPTDITGDFVNNVVPSDLGISIGLGNSNFGFIQSKDENGDILIDIYPDALGSRWRETPTAKETYTRLESAQALPSQNKRAGAPTTQITTGTQATGGGQLGQTNTQANQNIGATNRPQGQAPQQIVGQGQAGQIQVGQAQNPAQQQTMTAGQAQAPQQTAGQIQAGQGQNPVPQQINITTGQAQAPQQTTVAGQGQAPQQIAGQGQVEQIQVGQAQNPAPQQIAGQGQAPQQTAGQAPIALQVGQVQNPAPQQINITTGQAQAPQQTTVAGQGQAPITLQVGQVQNPVPQQINITTGQTQAPQQTTVTGQGQAPITLQVGQGQNPAQPQTIIIDNTTQGTKTPNVTVDVNTTGTTGTNPTTNINITSDTSQTTQDPNASDIQININSETQTQVPTNIEITSTESEEVIEPTSFSFSLSEKNSKEATSVNPREIIAQRKKEAAEKKKQEELAPTDSGQAPIEEPVNTEPTDTTVEVVVPVIGEIVYVDEAGNVVPAPLDIPQTIEDMRVAMKDGEFEDSLAAAELLKNKPLPADIHEEILYTKLNSLFFLSRNNIEEKGVDIITAAHEALNVNPNSERIPEALSALAVSSLALGRTDEANAHVDTLYRRYPKHQDTPTGMLRLANHYLTEGEFAKASKYLQILIDDYPTDMFAKEAALLQTKSLHKQGDFKRTMAFIDFMDRRWNRLYLTDPEYFTIRAEVEEDTKNYQAAVSTYWLMYNLDPKSENADSALYKIAHLYYKMDQKDRARDVLTELVTTFPESQYRVSSLLKIGENGIHDGNLTLEEIFNLLNEPNPNLPNLFYDRIIKEYPNSDEAKYAKLRLAAQSLWEKNYLTAADQALDFYTKTPTIIEAERALEILLRSVAPVISLSISEKNYEQTLSLWEKYLPIHQTYTPLQSSLRMALGRALLNREQQEEGEEMLAPFMAKIPTTQEEFDNGLYAYSITLANALNNRDWKKVLDTSAKVEDWNLPKDVGLQRLYSTALAAQNIGLPARSLPIWEALAPNKDVPLYQRAYAQYFLARDAERRQNLRQAYQANLDALAMFEDLKTQQSPYADHERTRESMGALMDITEIAGRYTESLTWLNKYRMFVPSTSPDYAGLQLREARLQKKMGDNLRWRSILEEVIKKEPESVFGKMAQSELGSFEMARDLNRFSGKK